MSGWPEADAAWPSDQRPAMDSVAGENFPVALRFLPPRIRRHLLALYAYARVVDDIGDEPDVYGRPRSATERIALLDRFEDDLLGLYDGREASHPVLRGLAPTIAACRLPVEPLRRLIAANRVDQVVAAYATFDDLRSYCRLSADPVGELVLHVFGAATEQRVALSDRICTALQLVEHLQDVAEDWHRGRLYLPQEDLESFGVTVAALNRHAAGTDLRGLIRFEAERAGAWLDAGAPLIPQLTGWARLCVAGYLAGGRAALRALARSGYDPLPGPPKPTSRGIAWQWLRTLAGRAR